MSVTAPAPQRLQWFFEELARAREGALHHIPKVFAEDLVFRDPFRTTTRGPEFRELFRRLLNQYRHVSFTGFERTGTDEAFTLTYFMHLRMVIGPMFVTPMASVCRARDGRVFDMRDYYDFPTGLLSPIRACTGLYRAVVCAGFL